MKLSWIYSSHVRSIREVGKIGRWTVYMVMERDAPSGCRGGRKLSLGQRER